MRKNLIFNSILTLLLFISAIFQANGQQRTVISSIQGKKTIYQNAQLKSDADPLSRNLNYSKHNNFAKSVIDTMNFPLTGSYSLYISEQGYVSGNNEYGDLAKANFFDNNMDLTLTGVLMEFAVATGSGENIEVALWNSDGPGNSPGTKLTSEMILLNDIVNDVQNEQMTFVAFSALPAVTSSFFVSVVLPQSPGDTLALWTNSDGDTDPATAWEQWDNGDWYAYDNPDTWALKISHAIYPIVTDEISLTANFSANDTQVPVGSEVQFSDQSIGGAISWTWEFEGGEPATSTLQNPMVTYNQTGTFDVKLKVSDGITSDSTTKQNFIVVSEQNQNIDTLMYPLPGSYVIFTVNGGGYVCGNNAYGDQAKANHFNSGSDGSITGMLVKFVWAVGGNPNIEFAIWNDNGSGEPGTKIANTSLSMNTIKNDVLAQQTTYVPLNNPVNVSGSFYAGFMLPTAAGDTLVVWSNDDGDTNPGIAWEMWDDNSWQAFNSNQSWGINCALAIHPIIDYSMDISEFESGTGLITFPNPSDGIFHISLQDLTQPETLEVFDSWGSIIKTLSNIGAQDEVQIDLTGNENGIYFIGLKTENGYSWSKVVKK